MRYAQDIGVAIAVLAAQKKAGGAAVAVERGEHGAFACGVGDIGGDAVEAGAVGWVLGKDEDGGGETGRVAEGVDQFVLLVDGAVAEAELGRRVVFDGEPAAGRETPAQACGVEIVQGTFDFGSLLFKIGEAGGGQARARSLSRPRSCAKPEARPSPPSPRDCVRVPSSS